MISHEVDQNKFLKDMGSDLANHYLHWQPLCQQSVHTTIQFVSDDSFLKKCFHYDLSAHYYDNLKKIWLQPYYSYFQRTGKLLRPYIICFCLDAYQLNPKDYAYVVGLAEIIHTASLVFDDIADDSLLRRGGVTAHQQVGVRVAGAAASSWLNVACELLDYQSGLSDVTKMNMRKEIAWEHWVTGLGSTIDVTWPWLQKYDYLPSHYLQSVVHRSTSYTYRLPFKIGALAAGADKQQFDLFSRFGESLGLAFQIIDDILNVKPIDQEWGKQIAEDITQGKITLQVLLALEESNEAQYARLIEILRLNTTDDKILNEAIFIMEKTGALVKARQIAQHHIQETISIVEEMTFLPNAFRTKLIQFVNYILNRGR